MATSPGACDELKWTLLEGSLDLFGPATAAADGSRSLDLSGSSKGKIRQSVPSNAGFDYELTFAMSGDPAGGPKERTLTATAGRETQTFTYVVSPENSATNMRWTYHTMKFKGTGPSTAVEFSSMVDGWYGPVIDDVKVFPIKGCSPQSAQQFPVTFVNNTKEKVSFHWLDFKCGEGGGPTVEAGASATGLTSPGHLFRVRGAAGRIIDQLTAAAASPTLAVGRK